MFWDTWVTPAEISIPEPDTAYSRQTDERHMRWRRAQRADYCTVLPEQCKTANTTYNSQFLYTRSTAWFCSRKIRSAFPQQQKIRAKKNFSKSLSPVFCHKKPGGEFDQPVFKVTDNSTAYLDNLFQGFNIFIINKKLLTSNLNFSYWNLGPLLPSPDTVNFIPFIFAAPFVYLKAATSSSIFFLLNVPVYSFSW